MNLFWNDIYKKWFKINEAVEALNIITIVVMSILVIVGIWQIILSGYYVYQQKMNDEKDSNINFRKRKLRSLISGICCISAPILWIILLAIFDAAGVGKVTSGDIFQKGINLF